MRYAYLAFPTSLAINVYDVLLVWQRARSIIDVGSLETSSMSA